MESYKKIYVFAKKWYDKLNDENTNFMELVDHYMGDDCHELGFEMDCGEAFSKEYGRAVYDYTELETIIDKVSDVDLLGSAIFSRWRYFNHWAYSGEEIMEPKNRKWFIIALNKLAELTKK